METKPTPVWEELITSRINNDTFKSRTCRIFNQQARKTYEHPNELCPCGRLARFHSFIGESVHSQAKENNVSDWKPPNAFKMSQSLSVPVTICGQLKSSGCKFVRLDAQCEMSDVYSLLVDDFGGETCRPALVLSVYGGAKYFIMTEKLEKEIIRGIIQAATTADTWILTAGINNGVSKLIGEGISHHRLLKENSDKVKCIGLTMWGTINESARFKLKNLSPQNQRIVTGRQIPDDVQEEKVSIEKNHSHCILFDNGRLSAYLSDSHRHDLVTEACSDPNRPCYAVTIIIEGGLGTLEVIENDIGARRPIVLIQGSGRLADALACLIEQTSFSKQNRHSVPSDEEITQALERFFSNSDEIYIDETMTRIKEILKKENRHLLNVFSLERDDDVAKAIFKAIFAMKIKQDKLDKAKKKATERSSQDAKRQQENQRRQDDYRLIHLALKWNYIDGVLPILKSRQEAMKKEDRQYNEKEFKQYKSLLKDSLENNRPAFVEYILAAGFDARALLKIEDTEHRDTVLLGLYANTYKKMNKNHAKRVETVFGNPKLKRTETLDAKLRKFVGSFIGTIYTPQQDSFRHRIYIDLDNHGLICCKSKKEKKTNPVDSKDGRSLNDTQQNDNEDNEQLSQNDNNNKNEGSYSKHELLRDLFLWSIFMDMPDMAKVILLHLKSRICAALIASAIFQRYAKTSRTVDHKEKFRKQSEDFGVYAAKFIDECYEYNERLACELLLRHIPLFGNVTCMQIAISSENKKLVGTYCFDQALTQVWYNKLSVKNHQTKAKLSKILTIPTFGLLAPFLTPYLDKEKKSEEELLSSDGIQCYIIQKEYKENLLQTFWSRLRDFHESPLIKMTYHFISYIWFLLVFSYMMLYHLDSPDAPRTPHWTEIYVIITVSTMLIEEFRRLYQEYKTRMTELWGSTGSSILTVLTNMFFILPYFLFYLGLGFRYRGYSDEILTTARIIWAFDLELWYLGSLKFIVALKTVGPKLFMLKNMLRDLAGFLYMIFIAVAAYGVVSRALILYKEIPFTASSLFREIFYEPYWFMYGEVSDKTLLDEKINNDTSSVAAGATATHVLLAFHMLFINILLLNLLIAVFTHSIDKVKDNTEFYWRYQRYSFVRKYFERPPFAYPPLIIFSHIGLVVLALRRYFFPKLCISEIQGADQTPSINSDTRVFKMIPKKKHQQSERWDPFENAATHSYARSIVTEKKKKGVSITDDTHSKNTLSAIESDVIKPISDQQEMITKLNTAVSAIKSVVDDNHNKITNNHTEMKDNVKQIDTEMKEQVKQMNEALGWIMKTMERVKMHGSGDAAPILKSTSADGGEPGLAGATTTSSNL